jgi:hypothetical protein
MTKQEKIETPLAGIFPAIAAAVSEVKVLGKSDRNKFDGYDFVSIDKFLALVNPICGRHGLFPIVSQREVEFYENTNSQGKKSVWARFFYDITLYHSSGETLGPTNIMVAVPMNGAQASGSAQSYALKQFFRAVLMIPTGDKDDADLIPTETHHTQQVQTVTPDQFVKLRDLAVQAAVAEDKLCSAAGCSSLQQFPADKFDSAVKKLNATIEAKQPKADPLEGDEIPKFEKEGAQ